jgi:hypothetical protein
MSEYYSYKANKYKLKYLKLINDLEGGIFQEEKALVTKLTESTPEKAITILANIIDVEYIQKIYDAMPDQNIKYNYNQIEIVFKIMQERILELYLHQKQNEILNIQTQKLINIEAKYIIINSVVTRLQSSISRHELIIARNIIIQLSNVLNEVKTRIISANKELDILIRGQLLNIGSFSSRQQKIKDIVINIKTELEIAKILVDIGQEIVIKIIQERKTQISNTFVGQKIEQKLESRSHENEKLKTRN